MAIDMLGEFLKKIDHGELMYILLSYFHRSSNIAPYKYRYQDDGKSHYLEVATNDSEEIIDISASQNFPKEEIPQLYSYVKKNLLDNQKQKVDNVFAFSVDRITGKFKYKDIFEILPVPAHAPKIETSYGTHPFILRIKYMSCPDGMLSHTRLQNEAVRILRILTVLSNRTIVLSPRYSQHHWVFNTNNIKNLFSEWKQGGYTYVDPPSFNFEEYMNDSSIKEIKRESYKTYFSTNTVGATGEFVLPDNLESLLDKVFSLDQDNWKRFYMAATWFSLHSYLWQESTSSALIALVTAIECLVDRSRKPEKCECCGQLVYSLHKRFKEFLELHIPNLDQFPQEKKLIYRIRSEILHGADLLQNDLYPSSMVMRAKKDYQDNLHRNMYNLTGIALYNWLQLN